MFTYAQTTASGNGVENCITKNGGAHKRSKAYFGRKGKEFAVDSTTRRMEESIRLDSKGLTRV
jgi:hypothetical protein